MECRSVLVNVGLGGRRNALTYATGLAQLFGAELVGVAAAKPNLTITGGEGAQVVVDYYKSELQTIETLLGRAEERFQEVARTSSKSRWIGLVADTTATLGDLALHSDVVVTAGGDFAGLGETLDLGQLILSCGRPVIVVADGEGKFRLSRATVAWKDTREARRAVTDALPLLQRAEQVKVVTLTEGDSGGETRSLNEIVGWLSLHGVRAESQLIAHDADFLDQVAGASRATGPDLVVSGGYGHSRLREWLFGGVTKDLLDAANVHRLFSN